MAFLEQISRRLTDAGQSVAQQTKNLTDTTRMNAKILENKKKISKLLLEMGQDYYQKHKDDADNEEQAYINRINELSQEITRCQNEIVQIKTAPICRSCGARITENSAFCMNCGAKLQTVQAPVSSPVPTRTCPACGSTVARDSAFCISCGTKLEVLEEEYVFIEDEDIPSEAQISPRICPVCDTETQDEDLFCPVCGTQLS